MQDFKQSPQTISNSQPKWYKTRAGEVFLGILGVMLVTLIAFSILIGYYFWQIKFAGQTENLELRFNSKISSDPSRAALSSSNQIEEDISKFIYPTTPVFGLPKAPITIAAFIDFECPYSQEAYTTFKEISEKYAPVVNVAFKHMPVTALHPDIMPAHLAAACAQDQYKFWEYYDQLFTNKKFDDESLKSYAEKIGLNQKIFSECLSSAKHQKEIDQDLYDGALLNVRGTPTYIINNTKLEGVVPKDFWDKIILEKLKNSL